LLDQLKQSIRPFHIRHTKERLIEFNDELSSSFSILLIFSFRASSLSLPDLILLSNSLFCSCNKVNTLLVSTLFFVVNSKSCCKSYEDLLEGINSLLTDIATLIKAPVQFSKLSTYNERIEIVVNTLLVSTLFFVVNSKSCCKLFKVSENSCFFLTSSNNSSLNSINLSFVW
jgi:hypothetical protein